MLWTFYTCLSLLSFLLIDTYGPRELKRYPTDQSIIYAISYSPKGEVLFVGDGNSVKAYNSESQKLIKEYSTLNTGEIFIIEVATDSSFFICGGSDSTLYIIDMDRGVVSDSIFGSGIITAAKISPSNNVISFGTSAGRIILYDIDKHDSYEILNESDIEITSIDFSPDRIHFASSQENGYIHIFSLMKHEKVKSFQAHNGWIRSISYCPDSLKLISCGDDKQLIIWEINGIDSITKSVSYKGSAGWITTVDYMKDKSVYAYGDLKGTVRIVADGFGYITKLKTPLHKVLFRPDNEAFIKLAIATRGKGVIQVDSKDMKLIQ